MAIKDATFVGPATEWAIEMTMTVLKYVQGGDKDEAIANALEDDDFVRCMERNITNVELITR
jgi:hypothetical protein